MELPRGSPIWAAFGHAFHEFTAAATGEVQRVRMHCVDNYEIARSSQLSRRVPLVVLVHGWPDCWLTWRHLLAYLGQNGIRAVAPDLRGFGWTTVEYKHDNNDTVWRPASVEDSSDDADESKREAARFSHQEVCGDLEQLLSSVLPENEKQAIFCGHDWGGSIVWAMAVTRPDLCAGVISLNTPYVQANEDVLSSYAENPAFSIYNMMRIANDGNRFDYQLYFNDSLPLAVRDLAQDTSFSLRMLLRGASEEDVRTLKDAAPGFALDNVRERGSLFAGVSRSTIGRSTIMESDDVEQLYRKAFAQSGWRASLQWYRNYDNNLKFVGAAPRSNRTLAMPVLQVCGIRDPVLRPSSTDRMFRTVHNLVRITLNAGHWPQQEQTAVFNEMVRSWLLHVFEPSAATIKARL